MHARVLFSVSLLVYWDFLTCVFTLHQVYPTSFLFCFVLMLFGPRIATDDDESTRTRLCFFGHGNGGGGEGRPIYTLQERETIPWHVTASVLDMLCLFFAWMSVEGERDGRKLGLERGHGGMLTRFFFSSPVELLQL